MSIRPAPLLLPLVFLALSSLACDNDRGDTSIGPSIVSSSTAASVSHAVAVEPAFVIARRVPAATCPAMDPFLAPVNLVLRGNGVTDLSLSRVHMQFMDRTGTAGATTVFTPNDLTSRFGTTLIPLFGTRMFPFFFPLGCTGLPIGTLTVAVFVVDTSGRETRHSVDVRLTTP